MSEHRPEPFTTVDGLCNHGFQCEIGDDGWVRVASTKRSTEEALRFLVSKGCRKVGLLLSIIPELDPYEYIPVSCETDPESYLRAFEKLDLDKLKRKPNLFFKIETSSGIPSAFINNG